MNGSDRIKSSDSGRPVARRLGAVQRFPSRPTRRQCFRPTQRLKTTAQYRHVFDGRLSVADGVLIVYGRPRSDRCQVGRLGLAVSRKLGRAVVRNRWKRRIREAFRRRADEFRGWDWVVIPKRGVDCDFHRIQRGLPRLATRLRRQFERRGGCSQS